MTSDPLIAGYEKRLQALESELEALDRERQKFASVVEQSDACVYVVDTSRTIRWANRALPLRFPPPEGETGWIGSRSCDVCALLEAGRDGNCTWCPVNRALQGDPVTHEEIRATPNPDPRHLYLTAVPIGGQGGRPSEALISIQDLTDLEVLRQSESRYRALFEQGSTAIVMVDPESWRIVLANAAAGRLLGHPPENLARLDLPALHPAADWAVLRADYAAQLAGGSAEGVECRLLARDGGRRVGIMRARYSDLEGRRLVMVEFLDITRRRQAEEALRAAEERLRTVVANAPLILFSVDRNGRLTLSEGKGLEARGLTPNQHVGRRIEELYPDQPRVVQNIHRALDGEEFTDQVRLGEMVYDTWHAPLRDSSGEIVGMVGLCTDVTENRRLEEQLRHSQKMEAVGRLAGGVAHDFNNLLTIISGRCELLTMNLPPEGRWSREIDSIREAVTRGSLLTRQLLSFSRREVVAPRELDLNGVVTDLEPLLRRLLGEDIALETVMAGEPVRVRADAGQLEQVLMNLAVNSREAMPRGGRLTIEVSPVEIDASEEWRGLTLAPGPHVMLAATDTGCGVDADTLLHLFEPFFTTKEQGQGTGLGLSVVYGIVRQNGGDVRAASEPGRGTTIRVYLPRLAGSAAGLVSDPGEAALPGGPETVLVVEDQAEVRGLTVEVLELHGYRVFQASSAEEALAVCASFDGPIDLALSDVVMPGMGGGELVRHLRQVRPDTAVLLMSGYTDDAVVRHGVFVRDQAFIQKPFTLEALVLKVRETLDARPGAGVDAPRAAAA